MHLIIHFWKILEVHRFFVGLYYILIKEPTRENNLEKSTVWPQTFLSVFLTGTGTIAVVRIKKTREGFSFAERSLLAQCERGAFFIYGTIEASDKNISPRMLNFSQLYHETHTIKRQREKKTQGSCVHR